ncbi:family 78 glycoside hydrolase catalytic domain, partial [Lachnospiraceae bacterium OttesenSCG-928-D06]|nr:family 78 glycoside hydrolase catalytic domain [Lachnospiraceae bacterium OttesenSCG-928-D06]
DMGQNFAGFMEFNAKFPLGTRVELEFGEILQQGNFYKGNYGHANSSFVYVSDGREETVRPHFTFFGFRYVRVTGWPGELRKEDFTGQVLYSDIQRTGYVETGNKRLNRLYENTLWGLKSNFIDIPTDCPQRSERLGWTGDAQVFAKTASYHMDTRAFFHKFIKDLKEEQRILGGGIPNYFPNIGHKKDVSSVWGDIATLLPDVLYHIYGSRDEMESSYPMMKDWVDFITEEGKKKGSNTGLYDFGSHFGDWLALDGAKPTSFKGSTDDDYIASVYYFRSVQIVREMSALLEKTEEEKQYATLEEKIKKAIEKEYFTPSGRLAVDTQAAYVIGIKFGLGNSREKLIEQFKKRLKKDCFQIKCGFVGAPLLCTALAEAGLVELAYDFLLKEGFPGWLYSVDLGATTIWERWNSVLADGTINGTGMNSLNHYAYGSVMEFVYAYASGIRPLKPGFSQAIIEPHPDIRLGSLSCEFHSVNGLYVVKWEIQEDGRLKVYVEIPFNCEALVKLPRYHMPEQWLEAGSYDFSYLPTKDFRKPYHRETTLERLSKDSKVMEILEEEVPLVAHMAASGDIETLSETLEDIGKKTYLPINPEKLEGAVAKIYERMV